MEIYFVVTSPVIISLRARVNAIINYMRRIKGADVLQIHRRLAVASAYRARVDQ